ncbi:hypothetical protein OHA25_52075 [Nonomuraea sp. NBC_00507]|uniref:hypothetical protein n=1 Tax=Nonomuraea sp. NBC_00507 TaxID=2976002 RepID=UPI002E17F031
MTGLIWCRQTVCVVLGVECPSQAAQNTHGIKQGSVIAGKDKTRPLRRGYSDSGPETKITFPPYGVAVEASLPPSQGKP